MLGHLAGDCLVFDNVTYSSHVVGLNVSGLSESKLASHMMYQLMFVLRSYSPDTKERRTRSYSAGSAFKLQTRSCDRIDEDICSLPKGGFGSL